MKICKKCGAQQSDMRFICIDCGEKLGNAISEKEVYQINQQLKSKDDKVNNKSNPLYVGVSDKIIGILAFIGVITAIVLIIVLKEINEYALLMMYPIVFFIVCATSALFPKFLWAFEKFILSFTINESDDATPSLFYFIMREINIYVGFILAVISLIYVVIIFNCI